MERIIVTSVEQMKAHIENVYKIQMAAVRVYEANEAYLSAGKARKGVDYDYTHHNKENNDRYFALMDDYYKKEGLLKKAVNNFFKVTGQEEKVQKWESGFHAVLAFNDDIHERLGWGGHRYYDDFSLYSCVARKY